MSKSFERRYERALAALKAIVKSVAEASFRVGDPHTLDGRRQRAFAKSAQHKLNAVGADLAGRSVSDHTSAPRSRASSHLSRAGGAFPTRRSQSWKC
jgi:hypothetical protein